MITTSTILSILIFSGVILILVALLNFAESKLLPQEEVSIKINGDDDKSIQIRPGSTLLSALAGKSIFLPSACGGGGTCALCKCQVNSGGGGILPTETGHINRREARVAAEKAHRRAKEAELTNAAAADAVAKEEEKEAAMRAMEREAEEGLRGIPTTSRLSVRAPVLKNSSEDAKEKKQDR